MAAAERFSFHWLLARPRDFSTEGFGRTHEAFRAYPYFCVIGYSGIILSLDARSLLPPRPVPV